MKRVQHKIRGSHPGFIGIELPNEYNVILLDEDNFNFYRQNLEFNGLNLEVVDQYCHFKLSWLFLYVYIYAALYVHGMYVPHTCVSVR